MNTHEFEDGEAMSAVEGTNVHYLLGASPEVDVDHLHALGLNVIDMRADPQRAAFDAYRVAFRANEAHPNLKNATALVEAYRNMMVSVGLMQ